MRGDCTSDKMSNHNAAYAPKVCSDPCGPDTRILDQIENDLLRQTHRFEEYLERLKNVCDRLQVWLPQYDPEYYDKMIDQSTLPLEQIKRSISKYYSLNDLLLELVIGLETL